MPSLIVEFALGEVQDLLAEKARLILDVEPTAKVDVDWDNFETDEVVTIKLLEDPPGSSLSQR